jgi:cytochrome c-type biogenesis protein CcmH
MIWLAILLLTIVALAPLARVLLHGGPSRRGRREAAVALHQAQLAELDRDLAEGQIAAAEHITAVVEVQRRLLAAAELRDVILAPTARGPLVVALAVLPAFAFGLYLREGSPDLPSEPLAARIALAKSGLEHENASLADLRAHLATLDPRTEQARKDFELLGSIEAGRHNSAAAAAAWSKALAVRFDPTLAAETAEAMANAEGHVTATTALLFRKALQAGPIDAPWRSIAERRLNEYAAGEEGHGARPATGN